MTTRPDRLEVVPARHVTPRSLPLFLRPHFVRKIRGACTTPEGHEGTHFAGARDCLAASWPNIESTR